MKKNQLFLWVLVCLLAFPLFCSAVDRTGTPFIDFETGLAGSRSPDLRLENLTSADLGKTMYLGVGAGWQLSPKIRADFTVTYRGGFQQSIEIGDNIHGTGNFQSTAAMANVHYDFSAWKNSIPFVGGGLGYVHNHLDQVSIIDTSGTPLANIQGGGWSNLCYQFGGGLAIPIRDEWFIELGYRYFHGGKYESDDVIHYAEGVNQVFQRHVGTLSSNEFVVRLRIHLL